MEIDSLIYLCSPCRVVSGRSSSRPSEHAFVCGFSQPEAIHGQSLQIDWKLSSDFVVGNTFDSGAGNVSFDPAARLGRYLKSYNVCHDNSRNGRRRGRRGSVDRNIAHMDFHKVGLKRSAFRIQVGGFVGWGLPPLDFSSLQSREQAAVFTEGPSCIFVGPLETANKATLEALYQQARDSYYSGHPLIVDDMFDRVETRLRWHGSKLVLKYPRCSLKRYSAYADAEVDPSQIWTLTSIWSIILASGVVAAAGPPACALTEACQKSVHSRFESHGPASASEVVTTTNGLFMIGLGLVIGVPVILAAVRSLLGLWRGDLVALKGCCPNCGEEVYAFVSADQSVQTQHKTECHVCEHPLGFRANVERLGAGRPWAYGRIYLLTRPKDLVPH